MLAIKTPRGQWCRFAFFYCSAFSSVYTVEFEQANVYWDLLEIFGTQESGVKGVSETW